jgi:protein O-GlcNAc transferase
MADPNDINVLFAQALRKHQAGHFGGAEKLYRRILDKQPKHRDSLHLLGVIRLSEKEYKDAISLIEKALGLGPDVAAICFNLARAYEDSGALDQALNMFERAQRKDPGDADIAFGIGTVMSALGQNAEAVDAFDKALSLAPRHANAYNNKGVALKNLEQFDNALACYVAAIQIDPQHTDAHLNRAALLEAQYRLEEAQESYAQILRYDPKHAVAWFQQGKNFSTRKMYDEAIESFARAVALQPDNAEYLASLLVERSKICDWTAFPENHDTLRRALAKSSHNVQPLSVARLFDAPEYVLKTAQSFSSKKTGTERHVPKVEALEQRKIKIGYISSDLHARHPVFQALAGVLNQHDRNRFDIHYFLLPLPVTQPVPELLSAHGDRVHDLTKLSDAEIVSLIRAQNLDVAVDLNGFTKCHKIQIFNTGVAPLQMNYLGSPGTMGSACHDYVIGDATLMPVETFPHYSEQVVWLPHSFFPVNNERPIALAPPDRSAAGLPEKGFVFGYFGMADRIVPSVFARWMKILNAVENSVLWLKVANDVARENLLKVAAAQGVEATRLVFAHRTESNAEHLARLALMDLCLDSLPYNAHMTALDCLFAGVPVLTLQGKSFASRVASSLLTACDLSELVCKDATSYEALAVQLATSRNKLAEIKTKLLAARHSKPLFDTLHYTRDLESAFTTMVHRHLAGLPPQHFGVS